MNPATAAGIGALAGFSIFIGLPIARVRFVSPRVRAFLSAVAAGILIFLFWDILAHASAPVESKLALLKAGHPADFVLTAGIFVVGIAAGLLLLIYFNASFLGRVRPASGTASPRALAMVIATGLGLHNLSEGLAIGQAAATGAIAFAGVLVIGFALHNITEGFGIAAPMAVDDHKPSWGFLGLAGLVGGGPTTLGTVIGFFATSSYLYVLFLAVAAGALLFVISEMFAVGRRLSQPATFGWGLLTGFFVAYATDLLLTYLGA
jgi:zinc transporter, ZIP family